MTLFRKLSGSRIIKLSSLRKLGTAPQTVQQQQEELPQTFRTIESNPLNHNEQHLGRFYTMPPSVIATAFAHGKDYEYNKIVQTFTEACLLIRRPAIDIFNFLAQTDYKRPVNKYVIYGRFGVGKSMTMLHVIHHAHNSKKIIVHVPWVRKWYKRPKEVANSATKEGLIDLPIDAATWLVNFRNQNAALLAQADLKLSKSYEWSPEDTSLKGSPINGIINLGIERVKYACDIIDALLFELKQASTAGQCKVFVAIDGFNALFSNESQIKDEYKQMVSPSRVTLTQSFLNMTKSDWCNGDIVVIVDEKATREYCDSHLPRYLLTEKGFEHMDPFIPISVEDYTDDEYDTVIEYYKNRKWIRELTDQGQKEIKLITGANPSKLMQYCKHL